MRLTTIKNIATWPVELATGRMLGPGETAPEIDIHHNHHDALLTTGQIAEVNSKPAKSTGRDGKEGEK